MPRETASSCPHDAGVSQTVGLYIAHHGPVADPPLILVHGAPDRSAAFRQVLRRVGGHDITVYDRRGYGRSLRAKPARTMVDHAHDLLAIADTCTSPPVVVAHSFGSNPTMLAATLRPDAFTALGLWEPPLPWVEWWPERTKNYNASVASSDAPADDVEEMYRRLLGADAWSRPAGRRARPTPRRGTRLSDGHGLRARCPVRFPRRCRSCPRRVRLGDLHRTCLRCPLAGRDTAERPDPGIPGHRALRSPHPPRGVRSLCALRPGPRRSRATRVWTAIAGRLRLTRHCPAA